MPRADILGYALACLFWGYLLSCSICWLLGVPVKPWIVAVGTATWWAADMVLGSLPRGGRR
jgi:hypothetical protein